MKFTKILASAFTAAVLVSANASNAQAFELLDRLFHGGGGGCCASSCCEPSCCEPVCCEMTCCEAAPTCAAEPSCCDPCNDCCDPCNDCCRPRRCGRLFAKLRGMFHRHSCCDSCCHDDCCGGDMGCGYEASCCH